MPFPAVVDLDDIAAGSGGFKIQGENEYDRVGFSVSDAGDVNGDGIDDMIVGAPGYGASSAAYVVFGTTGGFATPVDLEAISGGTGGFKIQGENADDNAGRSVSDAGDVNHDGIDDVIVSKSGAAYVVFGRTDSFATPVDLDDIAAGTGGFKIQGAGGGSAAGDVNDDGFDDLIVGARNDADTAGAAYVVFGKTGGFSTLVDLDDIAAGTGGFKIQGENEGDGAGSSVSDAGDVNGDGIDDLIVGGPGNNSGGTDAGAAYVVFGTTGGFATPVDLDDIAAGTGGFKIQGENADDNAGRSVSAAGDINGDGIDDVIVGALDFDDYNRLSAKGTYVVFGTSGGFATPVDLDDIAAGSGGFKIQGENEDDRAGFSVSDAGDVNGDGIGDVIVGAPGDFIYGASGAAYVVFGTTAGFTSPVDLAAIAAGSGGFKIQGQDDDSAGYSVSGAGDVNGDGIDDLIVGASGSASAGFRSAAAYVIFGRRDEPFTLFTEGNDVRNLNEFDLSLFPGTLATDALAGDDTVILSETQNLGVLFVGNAGDDTITGSSQQDRIRGNAGGDRLLGADGHDKLEGNGGRDFIEGGFGNDTIYGGDGDDRIVGQWGSNQLWGGDGADTIVCGGSPGLETVNDFEVGIDKVEVRAQGRDVHITFDAGADATLISLEGIGTIVQLLGAQAGLEDLVVI